MAPNSGLITGLYSHLDLFAIIEPSPCICSIWSANLKMKNEKNWIFNEWNTLNVFRTYIVWYILSRIWNTDGNRLPCEWPNDVSVSMHWWIVSHNTDMRLVVLRNAFFDALPNVNCVCTVCHTRYIDTVEDLNAIANVDDGLVHGWIFAHKYDMCSFVLSYEWQCARPTMISPEILYYSRNM